MWVIRFIIVEGKGIRGAKSNYWHTFDKRMWQRNYWEYIIRNELSYLSISDYIKNNPTIGHKINLCKLCGVQV